MPLRNYINGMIACLANMKTYAVNVALRLMLGLYAYAWWIIAPYSEYTVLEQLLLLIRVFGTAMILLGSLLSKTDYIWCMYLKLSITLCAAYSMEIGYLLIEDEASEPHVVRSQLPDSYNEFWWKTHTVVALIQVGYINCMDNTWSKWVAEQLRIRLKWVLGSYLLLHIVCSFGYLLLSLAPIHYYFYKIFIFGLCYKDLKHSDSNDALLARLNQERVQPFQLYTFVISFSLLYYWFLFIIDCMWLGTDETYTIKYLTRLFDICATSLLALIFLCIVLEFIKECAVSITRMLKLVTDNINVQGVFDGQLCISSIALYLQSGIVSEPQRIDAKSFVVLFVLNAVCCHIWELSERLCSVLLNTIHASLSVYLAVTWWLIAIVSGPTYMAYRLAPYYQYDIWAFFNITGVMMIVSSCAMSLVKFSLITLSWHVEDTNDNLADVIYYTGVTKSVVVFFFYGLLCYYRFTSPYFAYRFISTLVLSVTEFVLVSSVALAKEWEFYQSRQRLVRQINNIPDATEDHLAQIDDDCSICFTRLKSGKLLVCGHAFHRACFRKWVVVRPTCPYCNSIVLLN